MLQEHQLDELARVNHESVGRSRSPGDPVRHVDDPESYGTIVSRSHASSASSVVVLWSRDPDLDPQRVIANRIRHSIEKAAQQFVGQPNNDQTRTQLQRHLTAVMGNMLTTNKLGMSWQVDAVTTDPSTGELKIRVYLNTSRLTTTNVIDVSIRT